MQEAQPSAHDRLLLDQAHQQAGESLTCSAFVRGKVTRPMVQKVAGSGIYFRVSILCESEGQIQIYYPPFEAEPAFREWVFRTSDRIHRASNGKWSYVGKGGWKFNASSKGRKKRRTIKGACRREHHRSAVCRVWKHRLVCFATALLCLIPNTCCDTPSQYDTGTRVQVQ